MDKLVKRVTVIDRSGDNRQATTVYKESRKAEEKNVSVWTRPFERAARHVATAEIIFAQELLRRHAESNRRRPDGWLLEGSANMLESGRKAYNEARKAVPFRILPKK